jgi:CRISPR-associated endonuclease/helicase Cas3
LHPGFQAKGWNAGLWNKELHGHLREGAALFLRQAPETIARNLHLGELMAWGLSGNLLLATLAHHGRPFNPPRGGEVASRNWDPVAAADYDPVAASAEIGALLPHWFAEAFGEGGEKLPDSPDFQHLFCGLVSLADWLGSDRRIFQFVGPRLDRDYMDEARRRARKAVAGIGLDTAGWRITVAGRTGFANISDFAEPRPQQKAVGDFPLDERLVILEAETGSGKTEAALWRFARLFEAGLVDSLYFALPTRAAAVQIHGRVNETMKRLFGAGAPEAVLAVPGYLKVGEISGQKLPEWKVRWDDDGNADEKKLVARWAAENAKRYLAAAVAVGTVDQAMLAALQVKHAHMRAAALSRSLLVVDEVHASDRYMTEVQGHLLKTHLGRAGHAMLMSATLGSVARARWLGHPEPSFADAVAAPYPAVWSKGEAGPRGTPLDGRKKPVAMALVPNWTAEEAARRVIEAAGEGARVLVIRNTVKAAVATYEAVLEAGAGDLLFTVNGVPTLHHGRFAPEDRKLLDGGVERTLSRKGRQPGGVVVIGTQTLEQSLDIDSDILITDLCPVDVLLQRIGRLHRHDLARPEGFETPRCVVMTREGGLEPLLAPSFDNGLGMLKDGGIYPDLSVLELTRRLVKEHPVWTIPDMNRLLVESATHPSRIEALHDELGQNWRKYHDDVYGREIAEAGSARRVVLPLRESFGEFLFLSDEEKIRTRLGAEGARIEFSAPVKGPFGVDITSVTLPAHWSHGIEAAEPVTPHATNDGLEWETGENRLSYRAYGLILTRSWRNEAPFLSWRHRKFRHRRVGQ